MEHQKANQKLELLSKTIVELQMSWFEQDGRLFLATTQFDRFKNVVADVLHVIPKVTRRPQPLRKLFSQGSRPQRVGPDILSPHSEFTNSSCPRCPLL